MWNLALSKIVFAYNTEAFIDDRIHNYVDLDNEPPNRISSNSLAIRRSYIHEHPKVVLPKLYTIDLKKWHIEVGLSLLSTEPLF